MRSIKVKTWLSMMAVVGVIIMIMWLLGVVFLQNFYEISKEYDAKQVQTKVISIMTNNDIEEGYKKVMEISRTNDMYALIYDSSGNLLCHPFLYFDSSSGRTEINIGEIVSSYTYGNIVSNMIQNNKESYTAKINNGRKEMPSIVLINKFENGGKSYFALIRSQLMPVQATRDILKRIILIILILIFAVSVIMSLLFAENFTNPVVKLSDAVRAVTNGNYYVKIQENRNDELGMLQRDFNCMTKELSKVDGVRKDLIANVSHELRTPLTLIRGYAEAIKDLTGNDPVKRNDQLEIIIDETDRLSDLISSMLDLSKLQAGKVEFYKQDVNLSQLIEKIGKRYEIFGDRGYTFSYNIFPDIFVRCDIGRVEQVLCNLIDNAVNHSVETRDIRITLSENKVFEVNNKGDVIEKEDIPLIWDRYYKIDKSGNRRVTGTGIGLSIVKEILMAHNFKFGVKSDETNGTTFWVDFSENKNM